MGALIIGLAAGIVCLIAVVWLKPMLGYDDSLDAFGVHAVGGIVGAILTGVFAVEAIGGTAGAIEGNVGQIWIQIVGILATVIYCAVVSFILLKIIDAAQADTIVLLSDGEPMSLSILEMIARENAVRRLNIMVVSIHKDLFNRHYLDALATRQHGKCVDAEPSD